MWNPFARMFGTRARHDAEANAQWLAAYTRVINAKYDSAQTTPENERYWASTDGRSARAATDPATRGLIRRRARYEAVESGSYARGMVLAKTNDVVGRGPVSYTHL